MCASTEADTGIYKTWRDCMLTRTARVLLTPRARARSCGRNSESEIIFESMYLLLRAFFSDVRVHSSERPDTCHTRRELAMSSSTRRCQLGMLTPSSTADSGASAELLISTMSARRWYERRSLPTAASVIVMPQYRNGSPQLLSSSPVSSGGSL